MWEAVLAAQCGILAAEAERQWREQYDRASEPVKERMHFEKEMEQNERHHRESLSAYRTAESAKSYRSHSCPAPTIDHFFEGYLLGKIL